MTTPTANVYVGIDTHAETHHVAVIDGLGRKLGDAEFPTTRTGYQQILVFILGFGAPVRTGIEGTASYGAGVTAYLRSRHLTAREVIRPKRQARRRGKPNPIDAYAAAGAAAVDEDLPIPKLLGGPIDVIRVILKARKTALKARTAAITQIKNFLVTAPAHLRETYAHLPTGKLITTLAAVSTGPGEPLTAVLRRLARRVQFLDEEEFGAEAELASLTAEVAPALANAHAVGPVTAAQLLVTAGENPERITSKDAFAALCGTSPIPASSGKTHRYRLNRGGDRQANSALPQIVVVRLGNDPRTKNYLAKRTAEGKSKRETMRCCRAHVLQHTGQGHPSPRV